MVHNGIEYGIMAAYAEGFGILQACQYRQAKPASRRRNDAACATPNIINTILNLPDIAEVWRRGSVIASWLLDLTAIALTDDPKLTQFAGRVSDSGEGRWTIKAAIDEGVPVPVLSSALYAAVHLARRKRTIQDKLLSAMRFQFGGHLEKPVGAKDDAMSASHSDALVFFGATGDLAYKKIFPSLQAMLKRGHLNVPVIGVAKAGWNLDQLKDRAKDSLEKHGGLDPAAFEKLSGLLRYVDGDYNDSATFQAIRKELGSAQRPAHYLAIPPVLFGKVVEQLGAADCAGKGARVIVEKPFGTDLASAQRLNSILLGAFDEKRIFRIDHYLGKKPVHNMLFCAVRQRDVRAVLEPRAHRERADHDGRGLRRAGAWRFLRSDRHHPRRDPEPLVPDDGEPRHGAARPHRQRIHPR